jgi:hypothetical protein
VSVSPMPMITAVAIASAGRVASQARFVNTVLCLPCPQAVGSLVAVTQRADQDRTCDSAPGDE